MELFYLLLAMLATRPTVSHAFAPAFAPAWVACRARPGLTGAQVAAAGFDTRACLPARVPGTAFTTLVEAGAFNFTDPFHADDLYAAPDIVNATPAFYSFFWRAELPPFAASADTDGAALTWLRLRGINYRAQVWLDGRLLQEDSTGQTTVEGMYHRWSYLLGTSADTSSATNVPGHVLAVLVTPPPTVSECRNGGQGGHHTLAKLTTMQFSAGWDWVRCTPDRNTGIWDQVTFETTGVATLRDPFVRVDHIDLGDATLAAAAAAAATGRSATVTPLVDVAAISVDAQCSGTVTCVIHDDTTGAVVGRSSVVVPNAGPTPATVTLPPITISSPRLWWPHTHGTPSLHRAEFTFASTAPNSRIHHRHSVLFGVRSTDSFLHPKTGGRAFKVNGVPVFLSGGNWITTDQFLRHSSDEDRYRDEVRMHQSMGLNFLRVWGGGLTERPEFYAAADALGMLVMQEFWMTGDNNGRWAGNYSYPLDHSVYLSCAADMIKMLRNHPSLLFWCGGNELFPAKKSPPPDIAVALPTLIERLDQPDRFYIASSMSNYTEYDPAFALAPKDGPYGILLPSEFAERNPGLTFWNGTRADNLEISFQPELGSVTNPSYKSMRRFLSPAALQRFPGSGNGAAHPEYAFHNWLGFTTPNRTWNGLSAPFDHIRNYCGGSAPANASEFAAAATLAQIQQYQALFEGFQARMWSEYTAVVLWKSMSPWPVFRGALYDNYLATCGGYWGTRRALGADSVDSGGLGLHVQLNLKTWQPVVLNKGTSDVGDYLVVQADVYSLRGALLATSEHPLPGDGSLSAQGVVELDPPVAWPNGDHQSGVVWVRLTLKAESGAPLATNEYWQSTPHVVPQNYADLARVRSDTAAWASVVATITPTGGPRPPAGVYNVHLALAKDATAAALLVELSVVTVGVDGEVVGDADNAGEDRVLPVWFGENFMTLLPGESADLQVEVPADALAHALAARPGAVAFALQVDGWNVRPQRVQVTQAVVADAYEERQQSAAVVMVHSQCGAIEGTRLAGGVDAFFGIPYAAPPVGALRWQNPTPVYPTHCWQGVLNGTDGNAGPSCYQKDKPGIGPMSEDCLHLHVWTPSGSTTTAEEGEASLLPVMVYLHGGSLVEGSAMAIQSGYGGMVTLAYRSDAASATTNVVSVGINYRLGVPGFLALEELKGADDDDDDEGGGGGRFGNYGLQDCIAALRWVQANIDRFGGDPARVTVYGQSSGGSLVFALMSSPQAVGLFSRAVSMSGSPRLNSTSAEASTYWHREVVRATSCAGRQGPRLAACLRALPAADLVAAMPVDWDPPQGWSTRVFSDAYRYAPLLVIDGPGGVLPADYRRVKSIARPIPLDTVPLVIGVTREEIDFAPGNDVRNLTLPALSRLFDEALRNASNGTAAWADKVLAAYGLPDDPVEGKGAPPELIFADIISDATMLCATRVLADAWAAARPSSPRVWMYVASQRPGNPFCALAGFQKHPYCPVYSFHAVDMFALFAWLPASRTPEHASLYNATAGDVQWTRLLRRRLVDEFARTGEIGAPWVPYRGAGAGRGGGRLVNFAVEGEGVLPPDFRRAQCQLFLDHGFYDTKAWVN